MIYEEIGKKGENVTIHLMSTWDMTIPKVGLTRTMGTSGRIGVMIISRMVLLAFRQA